MSQDSGWRSSVLWRRGAHRLKGWADGAPAY